jgi:hypothetical protein
MAGSKRKQGAQSDFKRIKAKVGKKAQRLNDTDVSFKATSLHVGGQSIQQSNETQNSTSSAVLVSSRGKFLNELVSIATSHPAAAARCSGLKGILDIVKNHRPEALLPNLSTLIPPCVHSCVDEDADVRKAGIDVLSSLLSRLQEQRMKPFGALLIARVSSALHSLDASTRIDGVMMTKIVSTFCPSLTAKSIDQLLPPFGNLLTDQRTRKASDEILQSLICLLRVADSNNFDHPDSMLNQNFLIPADEGGQVRREIDHRPSLVYIPGGRSRNVVVYNGQSVHVLPPALNSTSRLSRLEHIDLIARRSGRQIKHQINLISKLRDGLIEAVNLENESSMQSTSRTARSSANEHNGGINYPRVILLLRSTRWLYKIMRAASPEYSDADQNDFDKVNEQIVSVLLEMFPVDHDQSASVASGDNKASSMDDANAVIAMTILEISDQSPGISQVEENENANKSMSAIYSYVVPRIHDLTETSNSSPSSYIDVTCKFIRRLGMSPIFHDNLTSILRMLQDSFFYKHDIGLARSNVGRKISLTVMNLIEHLDFRLADDPMQPLSHAILQLLMNMPFYLEAWAADFIYESQKILTGLHRLVRRVEDDGNFPVLDCMRKNWHKLVANVGNSQSTFESYPRHLKKIYLSLLVMIRNPSEKTLTNLASICGRSTCYNPLNSNSRTTMNDGAEGIVECVEKVRKAIPMQRYLTFLVQSMGVSRHVKEVLRFEASATDRCTMFERAFFTADSSFNRIAKALTEPGSLQVLRMVLPQLSSWQQTREADIGKGGQSTEYLLKSRASFIILAYFFLMHADISKEKNEGLGDQSSMFDHTKGSLSIESISHSIRRFIRCIVHQEDAVDFFSKLTSPFVAIMSYQHDVLNAVIDGIGEWFLKGGLSKIEQKNVLHLLVDWMKDPRLKDAMNGSSSSTTTIRGQIDTICHCESLQDNELALELVPLLTKGY